MTTAPGIEKATAEVAVADADASPAKEIARLTEEIQERVRAIARLKTREEPFVPGTSRVPYAARVYGEPEMVNLVDASLEFWLTAGRWHARLEKELAQFYGLRKAYLVNSGSSANLVAMTVLTSQLLGERRLKPGDEVITVAAGFPTTVAPILQNGLVPVFVDVLPGTFNCDVAQLEAAKSPRTRAVMMAHTLGNPFDLGAVKAFCDRHSLWLIEDNCDASGSLYQGKKTGTFGHLATLSFYPPHHMTTGEGGAVLTDDPALGRIIESIRDWGRDCWCASGVDNTCGKRFEHTLGELPKGYDHKYTYRHLGYNLKMTDLQASVGVAQLARLEGFGEARRKNWKALHAALSGCGDVLELPVPTPGSDPSWFGFMMMVKKGAPITREALVRHLEAKKIQTRMLFGGNLVRQPAMTELLADAKLRGAPTPFRVVGTLSFTDEIMNRGFWLGVYPGLTEPMVRYIGETITEFCQRA
jgi:CDP-6-deoxy-D-xylo-4-hexulose-3-dehydrase